MNDLKKDVIIAPEECKMMELMVKAGFSKLHPGGKFSTEKLLELCNIDRQKRVIDIGCGPGETTIYIAKRFGCHVTGVDIMPEMIKQAKENAIKQKVSHLTRFELVDAMSPVYSDTSFDIAIFQTVLMFGDKQKMLNFAYNALRDKGQVGAIELTWRNDPSEEIKETFARKFAEPLINVETPENWISTFRRAGFQKVVCQEIHSMTIGTFIRMWKGEEWGNKIKIVLKCLSDKEVIKRMVTVIRLLKKYPDNLDYGVFLSQK
jgi:ubiquinone/menaquinone biosynthesis C-methylase UbiE